MNERAIDRTHRRVFEAILQKYDLIEVYIADLSDDVPITLPLITFRLGDLRQLKVLPVDCANQGNAASNGNLIDDANGGSAPRRVNSSPRRGAGGADG